MRKEIQRNQEGNRDKPPPSPDIELEARLATRKQKKRTGIKGSYEGRCHG